MLSTYINDNLPSNRLSFIFNALTTNESFEEFFIQIDRGIIMIISSIQVPLFMHKLFLMSFEKMWH